VNKRLLRHFDDWSHTYSSDYLCEDIIGFAFRTRKEKVERLLPDDLGTILDVGCGPGVMVECVSQRCLRYWGMDLSKAMIAKCREQFSSQDVLSFCVAGIEHLPFRTNSFDNILCMGVLEYLDHHRRALKELARALKPGGTLILTVPNILSPYRLWRNSLYVPVRLLYKRLKSIMRREAFPADTDIKHREFSRQSLSTELAKLGLKDDAIVYYNAQVLPSPLDKWFPRLDVGLAHLLEPLLSSSLKWIGTGFIMRAAKLSEYAQQDD
jgi:ubiquinone/menaquinone biosynthesis C-methylase UbiE